MPNTARQFRGSCSHQRSLDLRPTPTARGYDSRWARFRASYLTAHPLCCACEKSGRVEPAHEVDHIIPLSRGGAKYDEHNLQAFCHACHSRKTWAERRDNIAVGNGDIGGRK